MGHVSHVTGHVSFSFLVVGGASRGLPHPFLKLGVTLSVSDHGNCQCSAQFDAKADGDQFLLPILEKNGSFRAFRV